MMRESVGSMSPVPRTAPPFQATRAPSTALLLGAEDGAAALAIGGMPLAVRAAAALGRSGVERCVLAAPEQARRVAADPRVGPDVQALGAGGLETDGGPLVVVDGRGVFAAGTVERLAAAGGPDAIAVARDEAGRSVLAVIPPALVERSVDAALGDGGVASDLEAFLGAAASVGPLRDVRIEGAVVGRADDRATASELERRLLAGLENVRDGRVDRWLNRRLSRPLSRWLVRTPLTPNHVSILGIVFGFVGAVMVASGGYWMRIAGLVVVQLSSVLDCCDGEMARLAFRESAWGEWLDVAGDTIAHSALFLGIGVAAWRDGLENALLLGVLLATGNIVSFACVTYAERTEETRRRVGGRANRTIDGLVAALTTRDYHVVVFLCALAGRLDWFLWGAAVGVHVWWMSLLALLVASRSAAHRT